MDSSRLAGGKQFLPNRFEKLTRAETPHRDSQSVEGRGRTAEGDSAAAPLLPTKRAMGPCVDLRYRRTSGEGLDSWSDAFGRARSDRRVHAGLQHATPLEDAVGLRLVA